jgi:K+-dependent Na+/Ca+ exchanger-like protein
MAMVATWWRMLALFLTSAVVMVFILRSVDEGTLVGSPSLDARSQKPTGLSNLLEKAQSYIVIDRTHVKWLWWPFLAYLFWGMAYICDDYFVRTIEVISERFKIPDDVAGATLMALGCNGPEMALNTIAIFNPSDIGVGAVIGGEVFNVLVIIGTAMLATPDMYLPLRISNFSFFRDVSFYIVSVMMLYLILKDGQVSRVEALSLICGAIVYSTTVAGSSIIRRACYELRAILMVKCRLDGRASWKSGGSRDEVATERLTMRTTLRATLRKSANLVEVVNGPRHTQNRDDPFGSGDYEDLLDDSDFENEAEEGLVEAWSNAGKSTDPFVGSVIGVKAEVRSRMMDRGSRIQERYMWISNNALMVSAAVDPEVPVRQKGRAYGMVFDTKSQLWHHGGLINTPDICDGDKPEEARSPQNTQALIRTISRIPHGAGIPGLSEMPCEAIPLKNVLYCDPVPGSPTLFTLHVHQDDDHGFGRLITLEFHCKDSSVHDGWVAALRQMLQDQSQRKGNSAGQPPEPETWRTLLGGCVEWLQFPVKALAKITIPDMDRPDLQHWYPLAFVMSMTWLAVFAYLVVTACDGIHEDFGISTGLLGFTIAAAGTSFPNVFSGMVVSRQGKTTMAIANALGANVQNVFLALAVPWTIKTCFLNHGPFSMPVQGLEAQIIAIYVTLIPVVVIFVCNSCTMPRWSGYVFLLTYCMYLVIALGQQSSNCMSWPLPCST